MITLALSKGRIFDETRPLLAAAGIAPLEDPETSRKLIIDNIDVINRTKRPKVEENALTTVLSEVLPVSSCHASAAGSLAASMSARRCGTPNCDTARAEFESYPHRSLMAIVPIW